MKRNLLLTTCLILLSGCSLASTTNPSIQAKLIPVGICINVIQEGEDTNKTCNLSKDAYMINTSEIDSEAPSTMVLSNSVNLLNEISFGFTEREDTVKEINRYLSGTLTINKEMLNLENSYLLMNQIIYAPSLESEDYTFVANGIFNALSISEDSSSAITTTNFNFKEDNYYDMSYSIKTISKFPVREITIFEFNSNHDLLQTYANYTSDTFNLNKESYYLVEATTSSGKEITAINGPLNFEYPVGNTLLLVYKSIDFTSGNEE